MLTIERTEDHILLKLPISTSEKQLAAVARIFESEDDFISVAKGEYDQEVGKEAVALGRFAKRGRWEQVKEMLRSHPQYADLLIAAGEEE